MLAQRGVTVRVIDRQLNYGRHAVRAFLEQRRPERGVLDIGAGQGDDLSIAGEVAPGVRRLGIEVHGPYVRALRAKGVEVLQLNIERDAIPLAHGAVDCVIANQILEHTKEVFWILHQVCCVLPVGGRFILGVPNLAALHNRILLGIGRQPSPIKTASAHVRGFTKRDLLDFFGSCFPQGLVLRGFLGSNFYPFPPWLARPLAKTAPNWAWGIFLHLEKVRAYEREFLDWPREAELETNFYVGETQSI